MKTNLKNLVQRQDASICKWLALWLLVMPIAAQAPIGSFHERDAQMMRRYSLEKNFQGFSYSKEPENPGTLLIRMLPDLPQEKRLAGVWIKANDDGEIQELGPLFETNLKGFDATVWALDAFSSRKLSFDGLWEVVRAATDTKIPDAALFRFMLETVSNQENRPDLTKDSPQNK
jgi:hypothetical protein